MKKTIILFSILAILVAFTLYNCKKETVTNTVTDTVKVGTAKITGKITYQDQLIASGAIVKISSDKMAVNVVSLSVADNLGNFSVSGLANGTYYLSAKFVTGNTNLKAAGDGIAFVTDSVTSVVVSGSDVVKNINLGSTSGGGAAVAFGSASKQWTLDVVHSRVGFSFPYDSVSANFYGMFSNFGLNSFTFDPAHLTSSSINAWVDITSTITGSPTVIIDNGVPATDTMIGGRDGIDGCIAKSEFQVAPLMADTFTHEFINKNKHDTIIKYAYHPASSILLTPKVTTDGGLIPSAKATFVSSSITAYGDGYVAAGSFYFHGMTKAVNLYFHYVKSTTKVSECSFSGFFDFKPTKDYGMVKSSHVGFNSSVDVNMNLIFALNP